MGKIKRIKSAYLARPCPAFKQSGKHGLGLLVSDPKNPRLILNVYSLLMWLAQPFMRLKLARRARQEPGYAEATDERFGS